MSHNYGYQHNWDLTGEMADDAGRFANQLEAHINEAIADHEKLKMHWRSDASTEFREVTLKKAHDKVKQTQTAIQALSKATAHAGEIAHHAEQKNLQTAVL